MDALSDVLRAAHLTGGVFLHAAFTAPWCVASRLAPEHCGSALGAASQLIHYHYIIEGEVKFRVMGEDGEAPTLRAGSLVLLPRNDLHLMGSDLSVPPVSTKDLIRPMRSGGPWSIRHGGGRARTMMICGFLGCDAASGSPIIAALPPALKLDLESGAAGDWIKSTFQCAAQEIAAGRAGSATVMAKLSELLFVEAVQRHVEALPESRTGWLAGLRDDHVARALALIHRDITKAWTVEELGHQVGLSRSALADRFTRLMGVPPIQSLANWRIHAATEKLRNTGASLAEVAGMVGYESEAAFSRAFKKAHGAAPAAWRRAHR